MVLLKKNFRATLERRRHDRYLLSTPCVRENFENLSKKRKEIYNLS